MTNRINSQIFSCGIIKLPAVLQQSICDFLSLPDLFRCMAVSKNWHIYFPNQIDNYCQKLNKKGIHLYRNELQNEVVFSKKKLIEKINKFYQNSSNSLNRSFQCLMPNQMGFFQISITKKGEPLIENNCDSCWLMTDSPPLQVITSKSPIPIREEINFTLMDKKGFQPLKFGSQPFMLQTNLRGLFPFKAETKAAIQQGKRIDCILKTYDEKLLFLKKQISNFFPFIEQMLGGELFKYLLSFPFETPLEGSNLSSNKIYHLKHFSNEMERFTFIIQKVFENPTIRSKFDQLARKLAPIFSDEKGISWAKNILDRSCKLSNSFLSGASSCYDFMKLDWFEYIFIESGPIEKIREIEEDYSVQELFHQIKVLLAPILADYHGPKEPSFELPLIEEIIPYLDLIELCDDLGDELVRKTTEAAQKLDSSFFIKFLRKVKWLYDSI